jgi:hypothetical protein
MKRNWKAIAAGLDLPIPESDLEKIESSLDALEKVFRPLAAAVSEDIEPAVIFHCQEETS